MSKLNKSRLNIVITEEAKEELQRISENHSMSMQSLVREYIAKGLTIETYQEDLGGQVTVNLPDGQQLPILNPIENKKRRLLGGG
jgi:predicted DNA-binding protein